MDVDLVAPEPTSRSPRRRVAAVASAAIVVALVATVVVARRSPADDPVVSAAGEAASAVAADAPAPDPFAAFGPGWTDLDPQAVHGAGPAALAWTGSEVVALHGTGVRAFDPVTQAWRTLPELPFDADSLTSLVWADGDLIAVSWNMAPGGDAAARLRLGDASWTMLAPPPVAPGLEMVPGGPRGLGPGPGLVWTGQRVIDTTHGAVLDPSSGAWQVVALPADVIPYTHLLGTTPVWDGSEVVLVAWAGQPGLAWDATGSTFREVPGLPSELLDRPAFSSTAVAVSAGDGTVTLLSNEAGRNVATLTVASGTWAIRPSIPGSQPMEGCPYLAAEVGSAVVAATCGTASPATYALADGVWTPTGRSPDPLHGLTTWLAAGDTLVTWTTTGSWEWPEPEPPPTAPRFEIWRPV